MLKKTKRLLIKYNRFIITGLLVALQLVWMTVFYLSAMANNIYITTAIRVVSLFFIIYILNNKDSPSFKLPWCLLIAIVPFFGILLYYLFGNGNPTRKMRKKIKEAKYSIPDGYIQALREESIIATQSIQNERDRQTDNYLVNSCAMPAFRNGGLKYFSTGEDMFRDMMPVLRSAEKFIFLEFFIIEESKMWSEILEALLERAEKGVDVRIIYDDFGSMAAVPKNYHKTLEKLHKNIRCIKFNQVLPFSYFSANCRDHRKIAVIDGKYAYTGGLNIADRYINLTSPYGYWKDGGVRIDGYAADSFTLMFSRMWNAFREDKIDTSGIIGIANNSKYSRGVVHPYCDMPHDGQEITENILIDMITRAKDRIYIFAPYLIIGYELRIVLCNAAKRGVDVKIITPGIPDKKIVHRLSRANYRTLMESGIEIYRYTPGFIHSKVYLTDSDTALVSTANMDYRSLYLLYECGVYLKDVPEIADIEKDMNHTLGISERVELDDLDRDGLFTRLFDSVLRAFETLF